MTQGNDFPLYIKAPREVSITSKEFNELSFMGLSSIFCSYPVLISKDEEGAMIINLTESNATRLGRFEDGILEHPRFEGTHWTINPAAELVMGAIPKGHPVTKTIEKYYSHLIMK